MSKTVGIIAFPGTNNEVESVRAIKRAGLIPVPLRWNEDAKRIQSMDAYFLVGGFSYEDRGRSGMVAARDPVIDILREEAKKGKTIIGHCNGAQILVESGLIPLGNDLAMSLARNAVKHDDGWESVGFRNEWVWITPTCAEDRCATSNWSGSIQIPIAHGEGRYVTNDPELIAELEKSDQIAFRYCDATGTVSDDPSVTPNGSTGAIAGICNPAGNVVALMPHPERAMAGDVYFASLAMWLENGTVNMTSQESPHSAGNQSMKLTTATMPTEIFIETIITNNEERTVEQAARRIAPSLRLKQYRYIGLPTDDIAAILSDVSRFNRNKERAYIRTNGKAFLWNPDRKDLESTDTFLSGQSLIRQDIPDTGVEGLQEGSISGICYSIENIDEQKLYTKELLEVFHNPHAGTLTKL